MIHFISRLGLLGVFLVFSDSAMAQGNFYRIYEGSLQAGEASISFFLRVNDEIVEERFGDPEIPGHGFISKSISVQMVEGKLSCNKSVSLENGIVGSCSGLRIRFDDAMNLIAGARATGTVSLGSSDAVIGRIELKLKYTEAGDHTPTYDE